MALFSYRAMGTTASGALLDMVECSRSFGIEVKRKEHGNALIHRSRNAALAKVSRESSYDYVLFVDDDMLPQPDALVRMVAHQRPVVSAYCTTRVPPVQVAAKLYDEASNQFVPLVALRPNKLVVGKFAVGAAFLLMSRATVDSLIEYHLSASDWLDENRRLLDRLHVRAENRERERARKEQLRRANFEKEQYIRVFDLPVNDAEMQLGEDIGLSLKLTNLGIDVAIDTAVAVGHIGEYPYGPWDLEESEVCKPARLRHTPTLAESPAPTLI